MRRYHSRRGYTKSRIYEDVEAKTYWDPYDNENIELWHRSMILIPESGSGGGGLSDFIRL